MDRQPLHIETPLLLSKTLSDTVGCNVWLKMECVQNSSSYKARGIGLLCQKSVEKGCVQFISSSGKYHTVCASVYFSAQFQNRADQFQNWLAQILILTLNLNLSPDPKSKTKTNEVLTHFKLTNCTITTCTCMYMLAFFFFLLFFILRNRFIIGIIGAGKKTPRGNTG